MLKIQVLLENTAARPEALAEHGLSLYIETALHKLLFDTGHTDLFARNARMMDVELSAVDIAVVSHGHYDHGGGLKTFMSLNDHAPVYINRYAFEPHSADSARDIGLDPALAGNPRLISAGDHLQIDRELELFSCNDRTRPYETDSAGLYVRCGSEWVPDDFRHEQYLLIHDGARRILVSGCSHKGLLNLMKWFRPDVFIGGFHFMALDPHGEGRQRLEQAAAALKTYSTVFYTGHCTGTEQYVFLKALMGEQLHPLSAGQTAVL